VAPAAGALPYQFTSRWMSWGGLIHCGGAVVQCPDGLRFSTAGFASANYGIVDVESGATRASGVLAGGRAFATLDAARAVGANVGVLGHVTATRALDGTTPAFLVGSTDGYLYAIDACAPALSVLWAMDFDAPVGEAVFADTDGDGEDEIVVEAADGFLYGIDTERAASPAWVYDTDPAAGFPDTDVDEVHGRELHALWSEVPGATGYEWALFTVRGDPVTERPGDPRNPFIPAGPGERRAVVRDRLVSGSRYVFAVRALTAQGTSAETVSDGVRIFFDEVPPDAGVDGGAETGRLDGGHMDAGTSEFYLTGSGCFACAVPGRAAHTGSVAAWLVALAALGVARSRRR
jgi:hypothetical protein